MTHRRGQSPDLEPKRQRAWERMDEREQRYVVGVYERPVTNWELPFVEAGGAYERVLYVLVTTDAALSAEQIAYMLVARHYRNADINSIRKQLAIGVRQGHLRPVGYDRYGSTDDADQKMRLIESQWRARRNAERVARVTRAAQLAGMDGPDLSMAPPEPQDPAAEDESTLEERFPGLGESAEKSSDHDAELSDPSANPEPPT